ncbi:hypothetical protein ACIRBX_01830 [Kitasatospora sp. NPDC096147]|uniref:hypothetical protein n=1 Tax=Kitasatospora sp. NPDC096147 TaxID=3364093 RepID=UPI00380C421F
MTGTNAVPRSAHRTARAVPSALLGCLLLGLTACSGSSGSASPTTPATGSAPARATPSARAKATRQPPPAVPQNGLAKGLSLPLSAYMRTYPEAVTVDAAITQLTRECMTRFGFTLDLPNPTTGYSPSYDDTNMARRYGITDRELAAKAGYGLGDDDASPPSSPRMSDAEIAVFSGHVAMKPGAAVAPSAANGMPIPKDGCQGEALGKVGGRVDSTLPSKLDSESLNRSQASPAVQAALRQWSACMAGLGYKVDLPYDAVKLTSNGNAPGTGASGVTIALADIDCKEKSNLVPIWFKADSEIQRQLIEKNQLALNDVRARITAAVKSATAVVG